MNHPNSSNAHLVKTLSVTDSCVVKSFYMNMTFPSTLDAYVVSLCFSVPYVTRRKPAAVTGSAQTDPDVRLRLFLLTLSNYTMKPLTD